MSKAVSVCTWLQHVSGVEYVHNSFVPPVASGMTGAGNKYGVLIAAAASSLCVSKPGAMPSLPDRASVDSLLQQQQ